MFIFFSGDIKQLFFRSDNQNRDGSKGFTAILQCFLPQDSDTAGEELRKIRKLCGSPLWTNTKCYMYRGGS